MSWKSAFAKRNRINVASKESGKISKVEAVTAAVCEQFTVKTSWKVEKLKGKNNGYVLKTFKCSKI